MEGVRLGGREDFFVKGATSFARGGHGVLERGRKKGGRGELGWREARLSWRTLGKMRTRRSCARDKISWTAFEMQLYSASPNATVKTAV